MNICFDMDGTIASLYEVENWLQYLLNENPFPYLEAAPMWDMQALKEAILACRAAGHTFEILSWTSKGGSSAYNKEVRKAKLMWLKAMGIDDCFDHIYIFKYGKPKHFISKGILIDDNVEVRHGWETNGGKTIDPITTDIVKWLQELAA